MPFILASRFSTLFYISLLFAVGSGQSLIKFVCQRNPTLEFCPFNSQNRRQPAQGQPWVTPPPIPHIYQPLQPVNGQTSRTAVPEHHEHISSFHSSRHRIAEPSESMQEEDDKQMNSQLNTPTRFSSKNGANEDKASSFRRPATSQIMSGSGNYNGVGVGSGFGIGIPGVGPIGVNSGLGVGVPGLSGGGSRGGGGGLFGIGSSTGVSAPFVGNIGVSSGLGIG